METAGSLHAELGFGSGFGCGAMASPSLSHPHYIVLADTLNPPEKATRQHCWGGLDGGWRLAGGSSDADAEDRGTAEVLTARGGVRLTRFHVNQE